MEKKNLTLELNDVKLVKRNFRGEALPMNERGDRTCLIVLDHVLAKSLGFDSVKDLVDILQADEWKVGWFKQVDEETEQEAFLPVKAVYGEKRKPNIYVKTGKKSQLMNEDTVSSIDYADISKVDVILRLHYWEYNGRTGYNNYIQSMEVTVVEDAISARNSSYEIEEEEPFN